jgi:polyvinyl alcohol dehydrogenase (cytochrome)
MSQAHRWSVVAGALALALAGCSSSGPSSRSASSAARPTGAPPATLAGPPKAALPSDATLEGGVTTWPAYDDEPSRVAAVPAGRSLDPATKAWTANLGGVVHGQVVAADGRLFAATETNRVVALDPRSGRVLWSTSLGRPVTDVAAVAGCGDIDPLGITSTPVVNTATGTVYVVGEVSHGGRTVHQLEGIDVATGAVKLSEDVDPPLPAGERAVNLLQRASLALADGRVYIGYGGNYGDCGNYHGWLVGVDETGPPHRVSFEVAANGEGGAIWQGGGAPAVDAGGDIYVSTGNASPDPPEGGPDPKLYTESVVKLTPQLRPVASYKDEVAGGDEDLSTGNPVLLPDGDLFAVGKTDVGYVLTQRRLSRVAAIDGVCGSDPDGGPAYAVAYNRIFVPCQGGGIQEIDLANDRLGPRLSGANSAPILIGSDLWALQYPDGTITEYNARTGAVLQRIRAGSTVASFASPSSALGLLLVPTNTGVTAFDGPSGLPAPGAGA